MRSNEKFKFILYIGFLLVFPFLITSNNYYDSLNSNFQNLNSSQTSEKIHIIGNSGWVDFKIAGKCTGNGNEFDPYVIRDLVIDAAGSGNCILIEDSDLYFRIENCILYNSGNYPDSGIQLYNVVNGELIDNTLKNNYYGVSLYQCDYNNISFNNLSQNVEGIHLSYSSRNNILGNNVSNNIEYGIYIHRGGNSILNNVVNNNTNGIYLDGSNDNTISTNIVKNNDFGIVLSSFTTMWGDIIPSGWNDVFENIVNNNIYGICLIVGYGNSILENVMTGCGISMGFSFFNGYSLSDNITTTNSVNGKPFYYFVGEKNLGTSDFIDAGQVILYQCEDSNISNLDVSNCSIGILLLDSKKITISNNNANYNQFGIYLLYSDHNTISKNNASNNHKYGIYLKFSDYNTISNNILLGNGECIGEYDCEDNIFRSNGSCIYGIQPYYGFYFFLLLGVIFGSIFIIYIIIIERKKKGRI